MDDRTPYVARVWYDFSDRTHPVALPDIPFRDKAAIAEREERLRRMEEEKRTYRRISLLRVVER